jgi:hypothetical protein
MSSFRWQGTSAEDLAQVISRSADITTKAALRHQRKVAEHVKEESILNSPVDTTALEKAHYIVEEGGTRGRVVSRVEVGGFVSVGGNVEDVSSYAADVHENYDDPTAYTPGAGTLAKRSANPERHVGSEFLARAVDDSEDMFNGVLDAVMDNLERIW